MKRSTMIDELHSFMLENINLSPTRQSAAALLFKIEELGLIPGDLCYSATGERGTIANCISYSEMDVSLGWEDEDE